MTKRHQDDQAEPFFLTAELGRHWLQVQAAQSRQNEEQPRFVRMGARRNAGRGCWPVPEQAAPIVLYGILDFDCTGVSHFGTVKVHKSVFANLTKLR